MTDTEITALAREYAEETTKEMQSPLILLGFDLNGINNDVANYAEEIIRFLLRRYCLMEKEKVEELYLLNRRREDERHLVSATAVVIALESLFTDLGKEVEP